MADPFAVRTPLCCLDEQNQWGTKTDQFVGSVVRIRKMVKCDENGDVCIYITESPYSGQSIAYFNDPTDTSKTADYLDWRNSAVNQTDWANYVSLTMPDFYGSFSLEDAYTGVESRHNEAGTGGYDQSDQDFYAIGNYKPQVQGAITAWGVRLSYQGSVDATAGTWRYTNSGAHYVGNDLGYDASASMFTTETPIQGCPVYTVAAVPQSPEFIRRSFADDSAGVDADTTGYSRAKDEISHVAYPHSSSQAVGGSFSSENSATQKRSLSSGHVSGSATIPVTEDDNSGGTTVVNRTVLVDPGLPSRCIEVRGAEAGATSVIELVFHVNYFFLAPRASLPLQLSEMTPDESRMLRKIFEVRRVDMFGTKAPHPIVRSARAASVIEAHSNPKSVEGHLVKMFKQGLSGHFKKAGRQGRKVMRSEAVQSTTNAMARWGLGQAANYAADAAFEYAPELAMAAFM